MARAGKSEKLQKTSEKLKKTAKKTNSGISWEKAKNSKKQRKTARNCLQFPACTISRVPLSSLWYLGPKKPWQPKTWQDSTLFSPPGNGVLFSTICGDSLTKLHRKPGEKGQISDWRKFKKNPVEMAPCNCRFLSLVVVERVLNYQVRKRTAEKFCNFFELSQMLQNPQGDGRKGTGQKMS